MSKSRTLYADVFEEEHTVPYVPPMDYPVVLRGMMKAGDLNQAGLAKLLRVEQPTVSRWIAGAKPRLDQHNRIVEQAQRLGVLKKPAITPDDPASADFPEDGIAELDVRGGMGGGGVASGEVRRDGDHADPIKSESWRFPTSFIREELRTPTTRLLIIETQGDSMSPTISPGERVIVDTSHRMPTPDGIYALRDQFDAIVVKRLQTLRRGDPPRIMVISDNENHNDEEVGADEIEIVGRVICGLKRY